MIFDNGLNYDYHFVIKELAKEFEREFNCLGKILKNKKPVAVPVTKVVKKIDKNGKKVTKSISYKLHCMKSVNLCIHSEYSKIRTRENSVFGNFSRSVTIY